MQYPLLVERKNGTWRALIPALDGLCAEGASRDEAVRNARRAAEEYLAKVEVTTIELPLAPGFRTDSPQALLRALEAFSGDADALREHFDAIAGEREREREEARRQNTE